MSRAEETKLTNSVPFMMLYKCAFEELTIGARYKVHMYTYDSEGSIEHRNVLLSLRAIYPHVAVFDNLKRKTKSYAFNRAELAELMAQKKIKEVTRWQS